MFKFITLPYFSLFLIKIRELEEEIREFIHLVEGDRILHDFKYTNAAS